MPFFLVSMTHPDGEGWAVHVRAHVDYLQRLVAQGTVRASGRLKGRGLRAGFIIFQAESEADVRRLVAEDPFAKHDLIVELTINEWEPFFGIFASEVPAPPELAGSS